MSRAFQRRQLPASSSATFKEAGIHPACAFTKQLYPGFGHFRRAARRGTHRGNRQVAALAPAGGSGATWSLSHAWPSPEISWVGAGQQQLEGKPAASGGRFSTRPTQVQLQGVNQLPHFAHSASSPRCFGLNLPHLDACCSGAIVVEVGGTEPKMEQWMATGEERTRGTGWHLLTNVPTLQCFT